MIQLVKESHEFTKCYANIDFEQCNIQHADSIIAIQEHDKYLSLLYVNVFMFVPFNDFQDHISFYLIEQLKKKSENL